MTAECSKLWAVYVVISVLASLWGLGQTDTVCPKGWMANEGNCYLFGKNNVHFTDAESFCRLKGGHLVEISNTHENAFLKDRLRDFKAKHWWIGITDEEIEGEWKNFNNGSYITFTDWVAGQGTPTNNDDCAIFDKGHDYMWSDVSCIYTASPVCEMRGNRCRAEVVITVSPQVGG